MATDLSSLTQTRKTHVNRKSQVTTWQSCQWHTSVCLISCFLTLLSSASNDQNSAWSILNISAYTGQRSGLKPTAFWNLPKPRQDGSPFKLLELLHVVSVTSRTPKKATFRSGILKWKPGLPPNTADLQVTKSILGWGLQEVVKRSGRRNRSSSVSCHQGWCRCFLLSPGLKSENMEHLNSQEFFILFFF